MEVLTSQGILISPNLPVVTTLPHEETLTSQGILINRSPDDQNSAGSGDCSSSPPISESRRKMDSKRKSNNSKSSLPLNLISATNQQKVAQSVQVKQQLPYKLATKLTGGATGSNSSVQQILPYKLSQAPEARRTSSGYQRLGSGSFSPPMRLEDQLIPSHTRTGSSPAMMQNITPPETAQRNKADRTNTYPKLPERYRVKSPDSVGSPQSPSGTAPHAAEEEVIFF